MNTLKQQRILQGLIKRERKRKGPDRERIKVKKRWVGGGVVKSRREDLIGREI